MTCGRGRAQPGQTPIRRWELARARRRLYGMRSAISTSQFFDDPHHRLFQRCDRQRVVATRLHLGEQRFQIRRLGFDLVVQGLLVVGQRPIGRAEARDSMSCRGRGCIGSRHRHSGRRSILQYRRPVFPMSVLERRQDRHSSRLNPRRVPATSAPAPCAPAPTPDDASCSRAQPRLLGRLRPNTSNAGSSPRRPRAPRP